MNILAIETSCDDTCISIIKASGKKKFNFNILSNIVSSQAEVHRKWGGVYPTLAKREHQKNLVSVLKKALKRAKLLETQNAKLKTQNYSVKFKTLKEILSREEHLYKKLESFLIRHLKPGIDLIAVTTGPGLEPCLWVGVNFAKALSYHWNLPIVLVNHIEAHIFANFINKRDVSFPAICLVVSGGNTQLFLMEDFGKYKNHASLRSAEPCFLPSFKYKILGETRDDAAGECFDKVAKILGLGYPGGPIIAKLASQWKKSQASVTLPRPMINQKNYDFSFSGLKTAVLYNFKSQPLKTRKSKQYIKEMCYETQQAIIDVLISKTIKAAKAYKAKTIILGGGVSANRELRKQFQQKIKKEKLNFRFQVPNFKFCTDNAAMVAITGYFRWKKMKKAENWQDIKAVANLRII